MPEDRLSGLWGAQTPMGLWLEDNEITTLFISGVNIDQCVFGTLIDAVYKVSAFHRLLTLSKFEETEL